MADKMTIEMSDANDINFPFEWLVQLEFGVGFVQITLVDDRIVIHKPTAADASYTNLGGFLLLMLHAVLTSLNKFKLNSTPCFYFTIA